MKYPASSTSARLTEIFSSLQGEGPYAGERHIFVRFEECHMECGYCDEIHKVGKVYDIPKVIEEIEKLEETVGPHSYISFTGGEPLLYLPFLKPLLIRVKEKGMNTFLETSGVLWKSLKEVVNLCDVISMDLKPKSVTKDREYLQEHKEFLKISKTRPLFLKMVVSKEIDLKEFDDHIDLVAEEDPQTELFLMPISTEIEGHDDSELMSLLNKLQKRASEKLSRVKVGIRLHRLLNIR